MKKYIILLILGIALYSCAKKIAPTASVPKAESPSVVVSTPATVPQTTPGKKKADGGLPVPPSAAESPSTPQSKTLIESAQVVEGKVAYKTKCGKCHDLKDPQEYDAPKWVKIIDWMGPRAKLDATEKVNVLAFVSFYAKR
jgi:cytochrome c5